MIKRCQEIKWSRYCEQLYTLDLDTDPKVLDQYTDDKFSTPTDEINLPILKEEVAHAIKSLKKGKTPGLDNLPAELLIHGGKPMEQLMWILSNKSKTWPKL